MAENGLIAFYEYCEVTEVIAFPPGSSQIPVNVFSVVVFGENSADVENEKPHFLNPKRLKINGLTGWQFGIYRYHLSLKKLKLQLESYDVCGVISLSGNSIKTGAFVPTPRQFVPPDATESTPLNRVLKNNFINGSYMFELFDSSKENLKELFADSRYLHSLSEQVQRFVPIKLASLSDRLGNILFQLPIEVVMCEFKFLGDHGMQAEVAWHPKAQQRRCRLVSIMEFDGVINGFGLSDISNSQANVITDDSTELNRCYLWDDEKEMLLAASGAVAALRTCNFRINVAGDISKSRKIVIPVKDSFDIEDIVLSHRGSESKIGDDSSFAYRTHIRGRLYDEERVSAKNKRDFVQYGLQGNRSAEHIRAIEDIRYLINLHGQEGVWLWDPYLEYKQIMETLFFCRHAGAPIRALGAFNGDTKRFFEKSHPAKKSLKSPRFLPARYRHKRSGGLRSVCFPKVRKKANEFDFTKWKEWQEVGFMTEGNNHQNLDLEFRCRHGQSGWSFHDRFLIFPKKDSKALAWSLGKSVNSLGLDHHILQKVEYGELVANAFVDLWEKLKDDKFLVWRCS